MGLLAPPTPAPPLTVELVHMKLAYWREHLLEDKQGNANAVLTLTEIRRELDRLLDKLLELQRDDPMHEQTVG